MLLIHFTTIKGRGLRALYDAHMKEIRDRNARDDYVRDEGIAIGQAQGESQKLINMVRKKMAKGMEAAQIAALLEEDPILMAKIYDSIHKHPDWTDDKIYTSDLTSSGKSPT